MPAARPAVRLPGQMRRRHRGRNSSSAIPPAVGAGCSATCKLEPGYVCRPPPAVPDTVEAGDLSPDRVRRRPQGRGRRRATTPTRSMATGARAAAASNRIAAPGPAHRPAGRGQAGPGSVRRRQRQGRRRLSHDCKLEMGFTCTDAPTSPPAQLNLRVAYRDFVSFPLGGSTRHPDFEIFAGMGITPLLVQPMLDAGESRDGGRCAQAGITAACPYDRQIDHAGRASTSGPRQRRHQRRDSGRAAAGGVPNGISSTIRARAASTRSTTRDGSGRGGSLLADPVINDGRSPTSASPTEIHYFFQYRGGESLTFSGDDDVWISSTGGWRWIWAGLHTRTERTLVVDQNAAALGVAVGGSTRSPCSTPSGTAPVRTSS